MHISRMSVSYKITASLGDKLVAEDLLFASSHPNSGWTKTPQYAPISAVPLKVGVLDQFRRTAASNPHDSVLAEAEAVVAECDRLGKQIGSVSLGEEILLVTGGV